MTGMNIYLEKRPTMTGMKIARRQTNYDWNDCKFAMSAKTAFSAFS